MKRVMMVIFAMVAALAMSACTRIETGEVGLRIGFDKQIADKELAAGSFNQTLIGEVITFPVREIQVAVNDQKPTTKDNSTLKDMDFILIYSINDSAVSEIWTKKSRGFHGWDESRKEHVLMYNYIGNAAASAANKAVRQYDALESNDKRGLIEQAIKSNVADALKEEGMAGKITVSQVQIKNLEIDPSIVRSANNAIAAANDLKTKTIEVQTAEQEAKRIAMLNSNSKAIEYMNAQASLKVAEAVAGGKVNTIVVPFDFKGMLNVK